MCYFRRFGGLSRVILIIWWSIILHSVQLCCHACHEMFLGDTVQNLSWTCHSSVWICILVLCGTVQKITLNYWIVMGQRIWRVISASSSPPSLSLALYFFFFFKWMKSKKVFDHCNGSSSRVELEYWIVKVFYFYCTLYRKRLLHTICYLNNQQICFSIFTECC